MPVITISRTLGSDGALIGHTLARQLDYRYFDRDELEILAQEGYYDRARSRYWMKSFPALGPSFRDKPKAYLTFVHEVICDAAEQDRVVIVGRAARPSFTTSPRRSTCESMPPLDFRVKRIMERFQESDGRARKRIKQVDRERRHFVQQVFGIVSRIHVIYTWS